MVLKAPDRLLALRNPCTPSPLPRRVDCRLVCQKEAQRHQHYLRHLGVRGSLGNDGNGVHPIGVQWFPGNGGATVHRIRP